MSHYEAGGLVCNNCGTIFVGQTCELLCPRCISSAIIPDEAKEAFRLVGPIILIRNANGRLTFTEDTKARFNKIWFDETQLERQQPKDKKKITYGPSKLGTKGKARRW